MNMTWQYDKVVDNAYYQVSIFVASGHNPTLNECHQDHEKTQPAASHDMVGSRLLLVTS